MQRVKTLLQKISDLSQKGEALSHIEVDLLLDYTRVMYADLLEHRNRLNFNNHIEKASQLHDKTSITVPNPKITAINSVSISNRIGINDKYLFISELFNNSKDEYEECITALSEFTSYTDAISWLSAKQTWDDENDIIQSFYSILKSYYPK